MEQQLPPLHLACQDDEMRPNMALIEIANNIATATNGHILVKIDLSIASQLSPETLTLLNGKYIHMEAWKAIHKCDFVEFFDDQIDIIQKGIKKTFYYSTANGSFFNTNAIVIEIKDAGETPVRLIALSPKLIGIIAKIFQSVDLKFSFTGDKKGVVVFPYEESGMCAILMPASSDQVSNRYLFY